MADWGTVREIALSFPEAVDASGFTLSSASSAVATAIGDLITILRTARERA